MNKYAGTKTEKNLQAAFAGESQARNKYTYFSSVAKKEGYEQIADIFLKTADNEKEHAKMWLKELDGIGDTTANLAAAAAGENFEWTDMYEEFAKTAEEEGFQRSRSEIPSCGGNRKTSRREIPRASEKRGNGESIRKKRSESLGMQKLRTYRRRRKSASDLPYLRASAEFLRSIRRKLLMISGADPIM